MYCRWNGYRVGCVLGLAIAFWAWSPAPAAAQQSISGKYLALMDGNFTPPPGCLQNVPIGTIAKGRKGWVVTVQITASKAPEGFPGIRLFAPRVNGRSMVGTSSIDGPEFSQYDNGGVTAVWWLDLDDAESSDPGNFRGKPLEIDIGQLCGSDTYHVTAVAQLLKN